MNFKHSRSVFIKEIKRTFYDKKSIFTSIIMPGLVIYLLYTVLGYALSTKTEISNDKIEIYAINSDTVTSDYFLQNGLSVNNIDEVQEDQLLREIEEQGKTILIRFPEKYAYDMTDEGIYNVDIFYNSDDTNSLYLYEKAYSLLNSLEDMKTNFYNINTGDQKYDLSDDIKAQGKTIAMLLPMLLFGLMFSSSVTIIAEGITGERERGTLAKMLMTPAHRFSIAFGKVIAISSVCMLSALSSYLGISFALPKLFVNNSINIISFYGLGANILLIISLFSTSLLLTSLLSLLAIRCKTIKEAGALLSPLSAASMLLGASCLILDEPVSGLYYYTIPFFNVVQSIFQVLTFKVNALSILISIACNLLYTCICLYIFARKLNDESVAFS